MNNEIKSEDDFVHLQEVLADPAYQTVQESSEWLNAPDTYLDSGNSQPRSETPENLVELLENVTDVLALSAVDGVLAGVTAAMSLSMAIVTLTAGPIISRYGSASDRANFELIKKLGSNPYSLVLGASSGVLAGDGTRYEALDSGAELGGVLNEVEEMSDDAEKIFSEPSTPVGVAAVSREGRRFLESSAAEDHDREVMDRARALSYYSYPEFLGLVMNLQSLGRELLGRPEHLVYGDPQSSQYQLSNQSYLRGPNQYGGTLPISLGGTASDSLSDAGTDSIRDLLDYQPAGTDLIENYLLP
jgi:hypothetical protein